ncbi:hypothetical protein [Reinekea marinisedimentorum]|uniref:Uncharacterized protein n=1 Tax=Reinekea marinisedimentorum TaxID=230495 RepID=A0A4R3I335_9GAMM|nr:hypothetical protein [Reinekea marinisedimentorum]TCS40198.1 hypothetical protein BCF53_110120 [Reinekea marinisedimentorum]
MKPTSQPYLNHFWAMTRRYLNLPGPHHSATDEGAEKRGHANTASRNYQQIAEGG